MDLSLAHGLLDRPVDLGKARPSPTHRDEPRLAEAARQRAEERDDFHARIADPSETARFERERASEVGARERREEPIDKSRPETAQTETALREPAAAPRERTADGNARPGNQDSTRPADRGTPKPDGADTVDTSPNVRSGDSPHIPGQATNNAAASAADAGLARAAAQLAANPALGAVNAVPAGAILTGSASLATPPGLTVASQAGTGTAGPAAATAVGARPGQPQGLAQAPGHTPTPLADTSRLADGREAGRLAVTAASGDRPTRTLHAAGEVRVGATSSGNPGNPAAGLSGNVVSDATAFAIKQISAAAGPTDPALQASSAGRAGNNPAAFAPGLLLSSAAPVAGQFTSLAPSASDLGLTSPGATPGGLGTMTADVRPGGLPSAADAAAFARHLPQAGLTDQVSMQLAKGTQEGLDRITIQLKPAHLGKVDVKLDIGHDGRLQAVIVADRADTLDLLQRDARLLERALQDAGFEADSGGLDFQLRGGNSDSAGGERADGDASRPLAGIVNEASGDAPALSGEITQILRTDRVDLTI